MTAKPSEGAEVIVLHPDGDAEHRELIVHRDRKPRRCLHRRFVLDAAAHKVLCRDCEAEIDPWGALDRIAREPERWVEQRKTAEREARRVRANLDELLRLERNAKARKRRRDA
jgi:hypothetical protein